jgi:hypothetical protein
VVLSGNGGRGGAAVLALLGLHWGWAADTLACTAGLRPRAKVGGSSGACVARLTWLAAQGEVGGGGGAAALALLALLGFRLSALVGCWGYCNGGGIGSNVGVLEAARRRWGVVGYASAGILQVGVEVGALAGWC